MFQAAPKMVAAEKETPFLVQLEKFSAFLVTALEQHTIFIEKNQKFMKRN